jgi:NADH-quinone oxidoreductase subunit M
MMLTAVVFLPLLAALCAMLLPADDRLQRHFGLLASLVTFVVSLGLLAGFSPGEAGMQLEIGVPWIESFGISYHVGVDGLSLFLVLLTTLLVPVCMISSYGSIGHRAREFVVAMLLLESGILGAFVALDLFLFFVFWELMLIPMYLLIGVWGSERRVYAALKFVIYTMVGSVLMLVAILYLHVQHEKLSGAPSFDLAALSRVALPARAQVWCFAAFALAFAIKVPLFPLHTWLPDAHVEAPTPGSVILAGVLLKLGVYGLLRFAFPLFPVGAVVLGPWLAALAVAGIVYGALVAYDQKDMKRLIAYSSVSHLGFCVLGLCALTAQGLSGSVFQMVSHGLCTGALFLAVGVLYERRHTRRLDEFGGLFARMPVYGGVLLFVVLASVGLPGLSGFVGEFLVLLGAFSGDARMLVHPKLCAAIAGTGVVLGAVYLLWMFQRAMLGPLSNPKNRDLPDLGVREVALFVPLLALILLLGLYPKPVLERVEPSVAKWRADFAAQYERGARVALGAELAQK